MATTIMIPQQIDAGIKEMCSNAMIKVVQDLAEKYGFDAAEAKRFLQLDEIKLARKRGPSPEKTEAKAKKESKKKANEDKPKRKPTGYILFMSAKRSVAKSALEAALAEDEKLKPQNVVRELAKMWKALEDDDRKVWNASAKGDSSDDEEKKPVTKKSKEKTKPVVVEKEEEDEEEEEESDEESE